MEFNVKVEVPGLVDAINNLAAAYSGANTQNIEIDKKVLTEELTKESKKQDKPKKEEKQEKEEKKETPKITLETVRAKLAELNSAGKGADVKALIAEFDDSDRPKLSNVAKEDYPALLEKASEL